MRLIVFLRLLWCDVNKSRNRQSQSWHGAVIPHHADNVPQPMPHDASPWLFSVNSALSRPSILVGHWCRSKAFNVIPPQTFTVLRFKGGKTATERNVCLLHKAKTPHLPFDYRCTPVRAMSKPCIRDCILKTSGKSPSTCLITSHMLTYHFPSWWFLYYCSFTILLQCSVARWSLSQPFNGRQGSWLFWWWGRIDWQQECSFSDQRTRLEINLKKMKTRKNKLVSWRENTIQQRQSEVWMMLPSINTIHHWLALISQHSAGVHSAAVVSNLQLQHVSTCFLFGVLLPSVHSK